MPVSIKIGYLNETYSIVFNSAKNQDLILVIIGIIIGFALALLGVLIFLNRSKFHLWLKKISWPSLSWPKGITSAIFYFLFNIFWLLFFMIVFHFWYFAEAPKHLIKPADGTEVSEYTVTDYINNEISIMAILIGSFLFIIFWAISRFAIIIITNDSRKYYFLRYKVLSPVIAGYIVIIISVIFLSVVYISNPLPQGSFIIDSTTWAIMEDHVIVTSFIFAFLSTLLIGIITGAITSYIMENQLRDLFNHFFQKKISLDDDDEFWMVFEEINDETLPNLKYAFEAAFADENEPYSRESVTFQRLKGDESGEWWFRRKKRGKKPCSLYLMRYLKRNEKIYTSFIGFYENYDKVEPNNRTNTKIQNLKTTLSGLGATELHKDEITDFNLGSELDLVEELISFYNPRPWAIVQRTRRLRSQILNYFRKSEISQGSDPYSILQDLEQTLRTFIITSLMEKYGEKWWKQRIPNDIRQNCQERKETNENIYPWFGEEEHDLIEYADFSDYAKIIEKKDNWREVFKPIIRQKDVFISKLRELEPIRKAIAHSRSINDMETQTLTLYSHQIKNTISIFDSIT
ncbi:MAG: Swt1 family HEPN domain-containing protein [Candidatus Heimdallarchaeota archaeon]